MGIGYRSLQRSIVPILVHDFGAVAKRIGAISFVTDS